MTEVIIAVDLGGTRIRAARLDERLNLLQRHEMLTLAAEGLDATLKRIKECIRVVWPDESVHVRGIGVSAPGPLNPATGVIVRPPNLKGWVDVPLGNILTREFEVPVYVGNDANVAALAETARGAAWGYRHVIYITVSTGIGSGIIYDGRLLLGKTGLAAEAGHIPLVVQGERVSSLEKEAAGPALARKIQARLRAGETSRVLEYAGSIDAVSAQHIGEAAQSGDPLAREILAEGGRFVGLGIVTMLHLFNPEIIVVGGGVSQVGDLLFDPMWDAVKTYALDDDYWKDLQIAGAALGGDVSIIGAGTLVVTKGGHSDVTQVIASLGNE